MFARAWAAACALLLTQGLGDAFAQAAIPAESIPVGAGLPDGKPVDIRGLHTGMPGAAAVAVLQQHYKGQRGAKLLIREKTLPNAPAPYVAYATNADLPGGNDNYDFLGAAFTSNASGNQVVSIISDAGFGQGNQPSANETMAAIKQKYGEPTATSGTDFQLSMFYGFRGGKALGKDQSCAGLMQIRQLSLKDRNVLQLDHWHREMADGVRSSMASNMPVESRGCDAVMFVDIVYGVSVAADRNLVPNKNTIGRMKILFFDAKRFRAAADQDAAAIKVLEEKRLQSAPTGKGPAKL